MAHVFLSYVREDETQVARLAAALRREGVEVWMDRDSILPGVRWKAAIRTAIEEGAFFVACFSEMSAKRARSFMNEELRLAIDELRKRSISRAWFIPILLSPCEPPDYTIGYGETLADLQWVDLSSQWDEGIRRLIAVIGSSRHTRSRPSPQRFGRHALPLTLIVLAAVTMGAIGVRACGGARQSQSVRLRQGNIGIQYPKRFNREGHLRDVRQLTLGGSSAEAHFNPDGNSLIYQNTIDPYSCDQEFVLDLSQGSSTLISSGKGRTTQGYFAWPTGGEVTYSSTDAEDETCPPGPSKVEYLWPIDPAYDIYISKVDGTHRRRLTMSPGYDAEAKWCHRGGKIIFTSNRDGDLDLYEMREDGTNVKRVTTAIGYDGSAVYSPDCTQIAWRAYYPSEPAERAEYRALLTRGFVRPAPMQIYIANADGTNVRQLTHNSGANFSPAFTPDGKHIIFSSNLHHSSEGGFDQFLIAADGSGAPERITTAPGFDGFPVFTPDGKWLAWESSRGEPGLDRTNVFIARWVN